MDINEIEPLRPEDIRNLINDPEKNSHLFDHLENVFNSVEDSISQAFQTEDGSPFKDLKAIRELLPFDASELIDVPTYPEKPKTLDPVQTKEPAKQEKQIVTDPAPQKPSTPDPEPKVEAMIEETPIQKHSSITEIEDSIDDTPKKVIVESTPLPTKKKTTDKQTLKKEENPKKPSKKEDVIDSSDKEERYQNRVQKIQDIFDKDKGKKI